MVGLDRAGSGRVGSGSGAYGYSVRRCPGTALDGKVSRMKIWHKERAGHTWPALVCPVVYVCV